MSFLLFLVPKTQNRKLNVRVPALGSLKTKKGMDNVCFSALCSLNPKTLTLCLKLFSEITKIDERRLCLGFGPLTTIWSAFLSLLKTEEDKDNVCFSALSSVQTHVSLKSEIWTLCLGVFPGILINLRDDPPRSRFGSSTLQCGNDLQNRLAFTLRLELSLSISLPYSLKFTGFFTMSVFLSQNLPTSTPCLEFSLGSR
jgi:hypothetical protein